jgi:hypothetical protein
MYYGCHRRNFVIRYIPITEAMVIITSDLKEEEKVTF